jgi:hypothetical protein
MQATFLELALECKASRTDDGASGSANSAGHLFSGVIMVWMWLGIFVVLAMLAPIFGADSRDSRDWKRETMADHNRQRL